MTYDVQYLKKQKTCGVCRNNYSYFNTSGFMTSFDKKNMFILSIRFQIKFN